MMKKLIISLILLASVCCAFAQQGYREATPEEASAIISKLTAASQNMKTLTCDFEQSNSISALAQEIKSSGRMEYRQEGEYLVWEYLEPYKNKITLSGGKITMGSGSGATQMDANSSRMAREISNIMLSSINGKGFQESETFHVTYSTAKGSVLVKMTPKQKKMAKMFSGIELNIDTRDYTAYQIVLLMASGDKTTMTIKNKKINAAL